MPSPIPQPIDEVYVVMMETRSSGLGNPLILAPSLAIDTCYRTRAKARAAMMNLAKSRAAAEYAMSGGKASPASLNLLPTFFTEIDQYDVLTFEGLIIRFKVEAMPLI